MVSTYIKNKHLQNVVGVYEIKNNVNNKKYIGSSVNIRGRLNTHAHDLIANRHSSKELQKDWNLYGEDAFSFNLLKECSSPFLIETEQFFIDNYAPEYNFCKIAGRSIEPLYTKDAQLKLSKNRVGPWKGKTRSQETKDKISLTKMGKPAVVFGDKHPNAKLTSLKVAQIRYYYSKGLTQSKLSKLYSIDQSVVSDIVNRKTWKSVEDI